MQQHTRKKRWRPGCGKPRPVTWVPRVGDNVRLTPDAAAKLGHLLYPLGVTRLVSPCRRFVKVEMCCYVSVDGTEMEFSNDPERFVIVGVEEVIKA